MTRGREDFFGDLLEDLLEAGLEFVLCGGMAAVLHGVERTTLDLDISVSLDPGNVPRLAAVMESLGLRPRVPVNPHILGEAEEVARLVREKHAVVFTFVHPDDPFLHVDIFIKPELTYERLIGHAVDMPFRGRTLKVLSAESLLELKRAIQPPREKDKMDIAVLEKLIREKKED
ncbi:MAG: nucleotidyl transferase AbiEii/AbiGii toxin family protein [Kiritimatiellae bacterium]|nr:nucleotidyl transferase AbiEii/AbiGii toxin family protein [Kiritimatiellia bacterium]